MTSKQRAYLKGLAMNIEPVSRLASPDLLPRLLKPSVKVLTGKSL